MKTSHSCSQTLKRKFSHQHTGQTTPFSSKLAPREPGQIKVILTSSTIPFRRSLTKAILRTSRFKSFKMSPNFRSKRIKTSWLRWLRKKLQLYHKLSREFKNKNQAKTSSQERSYRSNKSTPKSKNWNNKYPSLLLSTT